MTSLCIFGVCDQQSTCFGLRCWRSWATPSGCDRGGKLAALKLSYSYFISDLCKCIQTMIRPASFIYLKTDYLSHGVKILGLSVKTVGRLLFLRANAAKPLLLQRVLRCRDASDEAIKWPACLSAALVQVQVLAGQELGLDSLLPLNEHFLNCALTGSVSKKRQHID